MKSETYTKLIDDKTMAPLLGQLLLRDDLLPELLGSDAHEISYWAGKHLARSHKLSDYAAISTFFKQFQLGTLEIIKESAHQINWKLGGVIVNTRIKANQDPDFALESGMIAQEVEYILNQETEAEVESVNRSKGTVLINTYLSKNQPLNDDKGAIFPDQRTVTGFTKVDKIAKNLTKNFPSPITDMPN